jgi:hypothetical protein
MICPRRRCFSKEKRELMKGWAQGQFFREEMDLLWGKGDSWEEGRGIWNGGQARKKKIVFGGTRLGWVLVGKLKKAMDGLGEVGSNQVQLTRASLINNKVQIVRAHNL